MLTVDDLIKTKPFFVNEKGIKWWKEDDLTDYARLKKLKDIYCWIVQNPDGSLMRLITRGSSEILHEDTTFEGIACYIDALWIAAMDEK